MQKNIIQSQVQSLKKHPHIKKLQTIHNRLIQIIYHPKDIKSSYAEFQYRVKIQLPFNYPEKPPIVKFIDPITHINISKKSGEVAMPLLLEDWSPYISLYIIVDLLDTILVEPQLSERYYIGEKSNRHHKQKTNDSTLIKRPEDIPIFKTSQQEEISMIKKISSNQKKHQIQEEELKPIGTMKKKLKRLKTIILQKSQRMDLFQQKPPSPNHMRIFNEVDKIQQEQSFILNQKQDEKPIKNKLQTKTSTLYRNSKPPQLLLISQPIDPKVQSKQKQPQNIREEMQDKRHVKLTTKNYNENKVEYTIQKRQRQLTFHQKQQSTVKKKVEELEQRGPNSLNSTIYFQKTTNNLTKINRLIELFSQQLKQLQRKKSQTTNPYFTKIVQKKIQQQINMLQELEELSLTVKKNMISSLKKHLNK